MAAANSQECPESGGAVPALHHRVGVEPAREEGSDCEKDGEATPGREETIRAASKDMQSRKSRRQTFGSRGSLIPLVSLP
jgi:hypothetical protein